MLQPKRTKFRKMHKGRNTGLAHRGSTVAFGQIGLKSLTRGRMTARQIEAARRTITRKIKRGGKIRVMRNDKQIADVDIANLKRFKDEVKEVSSGYECGISLDGWDDIQSGDILQAYIVEEYRD